MMHGTMNVKPNLMEMLEILPKYKKFAALYGIQISCAVFNASRHLFFLELNELFHVITSHFLHLFLYSMFISRCWLFSL